MMMKWSTFLHQKVPIVGRALSGLVDRSLLRRYGIDLVSHRIRVAHLHIPHPVGVLLGGNGLVSEGRVAVMAGVKFVGRSPDDPLYLERHASGDVFRLGDNVTIGTNSVLVGPLEICDNVVIGSMSLVNRSISEPGLYVGAPARRIDGPVPNDVWVRTR